MPAWPVCLVARCQAVVVVSTFVLPVKGGHETAYARRYHAHKRRVLCLRKKKFIVLNAEEYIQKLFRMTTAMNVLIAKQIHMKVGLELPGKLRIGFLVTVG